MPVNIPFLKTTLGQCLGHSVEVRRLFDFLGEITESSSQKCKLSDFMEKWKPCLNKSSRKVMLVSYTGTWNPKCISKQILSTQEHWNDFARKYDSSYTECTVDSQSSPDFQPFNFRELIRLTFWKELYEAFGNKILAYIFDKCALLYETDEGLYLLVGYSQGIIYKKLWKFDKKYLKKMSYSCTQQPRERKNPYQLCRQKECNEVVVGKKNYKSLADKHHVNINHNSRQRVAVKRTRVNSVADDVDTKQPPLKQIKLDIHTGNEAAKNARPVCEYRWISPKAEVLKQLIELRNSTMKSFNLLTNDTPMNNLLDKQVLKYVCIQNDLIFKPKDKLFVLKQKASFSARNPKLPHDWTGLRLPENLPSLSDGKGRIHVEVYIISESLATKMKIRLKPKGRQRKKTKTSQNIQSSNPTATVTGTKLLPENLGTPNANTSSRMNYEEMLLAQGKSNIQNVSKNKSKKQHTFTTGTQIGVNGWPTMEPFCLNYTLSISSCLYNKSSWSKWPTSHCLSKALPCFKQQDNVGAIDIIVKDILKSGISTEPAHKNMQQSLTKWKFADDSNPLNEILISIFQSHSKFKDIHKLFKNCVSYWRKKYLLKQERKSLSKIAARSGAHNAPVVEEVRIEKTTDTNFCSRNSELEILEPEVVTLSQSTSSTHYTTANNSSLSPVNATVECAPCTSKSVVFSKAKFQAGSSNLKGASSRRKYELFRKCSENSQKNRSFKSLKYPVPHNCIMQSLKQIFHIMKVDNLLGSKRNVRGFFKFVRKALILGGTRSCLHLSELMAMLHLSDIPIFHVTNCTLAIETFTAKLVTWLFSEYVLVLLKTSFYITESNFSRLQLQFYLRESWISSSSKMKTYLIDNGALAAVKSNSEVKPNAILRYVPKQNHCLRSLLITKKSAWGLTKEESKVFHMYLHYIDAKINKSRMYLPTTIQYEWRKFISGWKANESPKLYYLRMDIRDAYPSVSLNKLNQILLTAGCEKGHKIYVKKYAIFGGKAKKSLRESLFDSQSRDNWHSGIHVRPCIAMDTENDIEINVWNMLERITKIITTTNIVKLGKKSFEFHYGLPQGWSQSPILCSIYYGFIDSTLYLPYLETDGRLFLRVVDDYLFITPYPMEILNLMQLMKIGCEKYGIKMNKEKLINNIFIRSDKEVAKNNCELVTYCGWNFCFTCGHVSRDFKKYVGQDFCSTITFDMRVNMKSPEEFIRHRGTWIVPARIKPILLDPTINCYKRILLTVFEASIVLSFRLYAMCRVLYPNLNALKEEERVKLIISAIQLCCTRLAKYVAQKADHHGPTFSSQEKAFCSNSCCGNQIATNIASVSTSLNTPDTLRNALSVDSVKFTALHGFQVKLLNHFGVFEKVIPLLNQSISKIKRKLGDNHCNKIVSIVGSKMPDCLSEIRI